MEIVTVAEKGFPSTGEAGVVVTEREGVRRIWTAFCPKMRLLEWPAKIRLTMTGATESFPLLACGSVVTE